MFRVENADFIADKLAAELLPNQEFREVLKNAEEAVARRIASSPGGPGRIEFDVDWPMRRAGWFICCADNGDGMTSDELQRYTTTLAVQGAGRNQSLHGNQGMGLKISGPTRHKRGILIRTMKAGQRTMVQIGWNGTEYGLLPIGPDNEFVTAAPLESFPSFIQEQGCGTVVSFFGNVEGDNTFVPSGRPRGWLLKYLNTRFFRLSQDGSEVVVRVASGEEEDWPQTAEEARDRMRKQGGRSFNLTRVRGTAEIWTEASARQGEGNSGVVSLQGDPAEAIPPADIHWWVLPTGPGTDVSSRTASGGSLAILFQNELHDWRTSNQANPHFARLGVLFAKARIAFVVEPRGTNITSDFARAHVLVAGKPVLESDAWLRWSQQFREAIPDRIRQTMAEEQSRVQAEDPDRARRIQERLREVMQLLRPRRFKPAPTGAARAAGRSVVGPGSAPGTTVERVPGPGRPAPRRPGVRGLGAVLAELDDSHGVPAVEVYAAQPLDLHWIKETDAEQYAIVSGDGNGLNDRAAALAGTDGRSAQMLLLNRDFRGYQAILAAMNDWANPEGDEDKAKRIEAAAQEWIDQKMIEAVQGLRQLENGKTWITEHYDQALSPIALTAAFMADRFHTVREIKRALGPLRQA